MFIFLISAVFSFEIPLINLQQIYYGMPLLINNKTYNVVLDTGSSQFWLDGRKYNCKIDCERLNQITEIQYAVGRVKGQQVRQVINGTKLDLLEVDQMQDLDQFLGDGVIGFAKPEKNEITYLEQLHQAKMIPNKGFGLLLSDKYCGRNSILSLGEWKENHFTGDMRTVEATQDQLWSVHFTSIDLVNEQERVKLNLTVNKLLIDSGTTKITLPNAEFEQISKSFECWEESSYGVIHLTCPHQVYKNIEIKLPNITFTLLPQDYISHCYYSWWNYVCKSQFEKMPGQEIVLGAVFMQKYYTYFDLEKNTISFAISSYYNRDRSPLRTLHHLDTLYLGVGFVTLLCGLAYIVLGIFIKMTMPLYQTVLEKSSSRSQEQDHEMMTLKTQHTPTLSP